MSQSRKRSAMEAVTNVLIGCGISWSATMVVLPAFGYQVTASHAGWMTILFTGISLARSYCLRRLFNLGDGRNPAPTRRQTTPGRDRRILARLPGQYPSEGDTMSADALFAFRQNLAQFVADHIESVQAESGMEIEHISISLLHERSRTRLLRTIVLDVGIASALPPYPQNEQIT